MKWTYSCIHDRESAIHQAHVDMHLKKKIWTILSGEYKWSDILSKNGLYIYSKPLSVGRRQTIGGCLLGRCRHKEWRDGLVSWINRSSHSKASLSRDQNLFPKVLPLPGRMGVHCHLGPGCILWLYNLWKGSGRYCTSQEFNSISININEVKWIFLDSLYVHADI